MNQSFPVKDLLRRPLQTSLTITTLTLSVASTLFLMLFSVRVGIGIFAQTSTLTTGLSVVFSQILAFIEPLVFIVGGILTSFIVFLMMTQRTHDLGLIKAAGCPGSLVAGYFTTELLIVAVSGCLLGTFFGVTADFLVATLVLGSYILPNLLYVFFVFGVFLVLALVFGIKPIIDAARMPPINALSPVTYYGIVAEKKHKPLSKFGITWKIATRSLSRRQNAVVRMVILLSAVFVLLTISIAGGIIARDTTSSWVQDPVSINTFNSVAVAHGDLGEQYLHLLATFSGESVDSGFDYSNSDYAVSQEAINSLGALSTVSVVDERLVLQTHILEGRNFTVVNGKADFVGGHREGDSLIIGLNPKNTQGPLSFKGRFLANEAGFEAVIGDSIATKMYSPDLNAKINYSDPLVQTVKMYNKTFDINGVCIDPINKGFITYVPIETLENLTGYNPNILLVTPKDDVDKTVFIEQLEQTLNAIDTDLQVFPLDTVTQRNLNYLGVSWTVIMFVPLVTLASAAICLVGFQVLSVEEQHQEFGVLRAIGTKPRIVVSILSIQGLIVLFSSFGVGIAFGIMITLMILMANPLVTTWTIVGIAAWLLTALVVMFFLSLYPAIKISKASILKILT
ncbi:MAG: ABC transporter permease [Candidatus Bathyarchaeia archaeon]|jgi:ABC-type antimicrobial peptide transport system permease subunit